MSTTFPTTLDTFPTIAPTDQEDATGKEHDVVHNNEMDAIAALQAKVGINGSAVTTSIDYILARVPRYFRRDEFTASAGDDQFLLNKTPFASPSSTVSVLVDGVEVPHSALSFVLPYIVLSTPLSGGETVVLTYFSTLSPSATALGSSSTHDIYITDVVSLVHFDGVNGATTASDLLGTTWTASGTAALSTTSPKFGTASAHFATSGGFTPGAAPVVGASSADFTIEAWFNTSSTSAAYWTICAQSSLQGLWVHNNTIEFWMGALRITSSALAGGWQHVALTRTTVSGVPNTITLWVDGVSQGTYVDNVSWTNSYIGVDSSGGGDPYTGYIDDFRMTDNVARYTSTFTPPTSAFPNT